MKGKSLLLILFLIIGSCAENKTDTTATEIIKLDNGKNIELKISEKETQDDDQKTLFIEYKTKEKIIREKELEKEILEIWSKLESRAEEKDIQEGVIKFEYPAEDDGHGHEKYFEVKLFSAEKIENGTWKIKKVN